MSIEKKSMPVTKMIGNQEFGDYLRTKPLYSKFLVTQLFSPQPNTYSYPTDFDDLYIKFTCKNDGENQTFKCSIHQIGQQFKSPPPSFNDMINLSLPPFWDKKTWMLDLTLPIVAECQFCKEKVYFLLNIFSDGPFDFAESLFPNIYIQKVGQLPAFDIRPEKEILNYVTNEDRGNYTKALANLSISYGIGAFAYFRRIIENEIKRMAKDIISLDTEHSAILEAAYETLEQDHQMNKFITALTPYIPQSLQGFGDNPIKLLYDQLSGGIHTFSDEECLEKAKNIDLVLRFTIRKLNEGKTEMGTIRKAMQELRNTRAND